MSYKNYAPVSGEVKRKPAPAPNPPGPHAPAPHVVRAAVSKAVRRAASPAKGKRKEATKLVNAKWSKTDSLVGDEVKLTVDIEGPPPRQLNLAIFEHDADGEHDFVEIIKADVKGQTCEATWEVEALEDLDDDDSAEEIKEKGYTLPEYFFVARPPGMGGAIAPVDSGQAKGKLLEVGDVIDQVFHDEVTGDLMPGVKYVLTLADGREVKGELDKESRAKVEKVPPGRYWFRFDAEEFEPFEAPGIAEIGPIGEAQPGPVALGERPDLGEAAPPAPPLVTSFHIAPGRAKPGDVVRLYASLANVEDGDPVILRVYDLEGDDPVAELKVAAAKGVAAAPWEAPAIDDAKEIDGVRKRSFDLQVEIDGHIFETVGFPELTVVASKAEGDEKGKLRIDLQIDPDAPESFDDSVQLTSDQGYDKTVKIESEGKKHEHRPGWTLLIFEDIVPGGKFTCKVDPGKEGEPYLLFKDREVKEDDLYDDIPPPKKVTEKAKAAQGGDSSSSKSQA